MIPLLYYHEFTKPIQACAVGRERIALFKTSKGISGMLDICPHLGIPLSGGWLEDDCIVCPWHQWTFDMDGNCVNPPHIKRKKAAPIQTQVDKGIVWYQKGRRSYTLHFSQRLPMGVEEVQEVLSQSGQTKDEIRWSVIGLGADDTRLWLSMDELDREALAFLESLAASEKK